MSEQEKSHIDFLYNRTQEFKASPLLKPDKNFSKEWIDYTEHKCDAITFMEALLVSSNLIIDQNSSRGVKETGRQITNELEAYLARQPVTHKFLNTNRLGQRELQQLPIFLGQAERNLDQLPPRTVKHIRLFTEDFKRVLNTLNYPSEELDRPKFVRVVGHANLAMFDQERVFAPHSRIITAVTDHITRPAEFRLDTPDILGTVEAYPLPASIDIWKTNHHNLSLEKLFAIKNQATFNYSVLEYLANLPPGDFFWQCLSQGIFCMIPNPQHAEVNQQRAEQHAKINGFQQWLTQRLVSPAFNPKLQFEDQERFNNLLNKVIANMDITTVGVLMTTIKDHALYDGSIMPLPATARGIQKLLTDIPLTWPAYKSVIEGGDDSVAFEFNSAYLNFHVPQVMNTLRSQLSNITDSKKLLELTEYCLTTDTNENERVAWEKLFEEAGASMTEKVTGDLNKKPTAIQYAALVDQDISMVQSQTQSFNMDLLFKSQPSVPNAFFEVPLSQDIRNEHVDAWGIKSVTLSQVPNSTAWNYSIQTNIPRLVIFGVTDEYGNIAECSLPTQYYRTLLPYLHFCTTNALYEFKHHPEYVKKYPIKEVVQRIQKETTERSKKRDPMNATRAQRIIDDLL